MSDWYDVDKTLSHNKLFNFVVGPRGAGKTYSSKGRAIKNWIRKGEQFVYLRRYETELKPSEIEKFFDDIGGEYPNITFHVKHGKFYIDGEVAGFYMPLSKAAQFKSVPYPLVSLIIFDEFIIDQGMIRYLPNEVTTFCEMYSTIARLRDVPVLFLSNAITFTNPYFLFFDIRLQQGQTIVKKGDIMLELVEAKEYQDRAANTRFGKLMAGTDYGRYAIENQFLRDSDTFIEKLPGPGIAMFNIKISDRTYTVYNVMGEKNWYVSKKVDKTCKHTISLQMGDHDDDTLYQGEYSAKIWWSTFCQKYFRAEVRFDEQHAKNLIGRVIKAG